MSDKNKRHGWWQSTVYFGCHRVGGSIKGNYPSQTSQPWYQRSSHLQWGLSSWPSDRESRFLLYPHVTFPPMLTRLEQNRSTCSFSFSFLLLKKIKFSRQNWEGLLRPQWVLQAQLFPLCLGSPGTKQLALRGIRSRSFIGQVRTYNLFYTQG